MPYITTEGRALPMDKSFSHNNVQFGANWLRVSTPKDKESYGIAWTNLEPEVVVRAPLEREKSNGVMKAKDTAGKMLAQSDWMVIASVERDRAVADDWAEYRAAVVAEADRLEGEYNAAATYTDLDLIKQEWPLDPNQQAERDRMEAEEAAAEEEKAE